MRKQLITDEQFIKVCAESMTMREASKKLNLAFTTFKRRAKKLGCYKTNQGSKGCKRPSKKKYILTDIFAGKYPDYQTYKLKIRLIKAGLKEDKCELCG